MRIGCSLVSGYICRNHHRVLPHHICGPILRSLLGRIRPSWKHQQMFPDYTTCRSVLVHSKKYKTHPSNLGEGDNIGYYKWWDSSFCPWGWWWWWWRNISHWTRGEAWNPKGVWTSCCSEREDAFPQEPTEFLAWNIHVDMSIMCYV